MRAIAALFVASSLISAPAFAQVAKDGAQGASAGPNTLGASKTPQALTSTDKPAGLSLGYLDHFSINNGSERPVTGLAPIEKDQLDFARVYLGMTRTWLFVHVPVTYSLIVLTVLHVIIAYSYSSGAW